MASKSTKKNPDPDVSNKLDSIINSIKELKTSQDSMKRMFESKLDKLRTDLMANVDNKVRALRDEISMDINRETNRTDQLLTTVQSIQTRLDSLEQDTSSKNSVPLLSHSLYQTQNPLDNPDITITASGLPFSDDENIVEKANDLIRALGEDVSDNVNVTAAARLPSRFSDRPAIVKISFSNLDEKVKVLRNKMKLKQTDTYKNVYIKSSKSRIERLIEVNARAVLRNIPGGRALRVDASGRIKSRNNQQQVDEPNDILPGVHA
ncbi:Hypothetical predicted protein [Mytilus galloprovincialis]|uniref:Uncharacterized protein n=1 Tax=Mytilus galloprovincialis TaxID=29158 RepID=A0A8B6E5E0_MYTGA|nr:Hypothetical predicted protein [Mytilus galloprovincialis]